MAHFGLKVNKTEQPDKTPYTVYYPHSTPPEKRVWKERYLQVISIDPARKNYAIRIEKRYSRRKAEPLLYVKTGFNKVSDDETLNILYDQITAHLQQFIQLFRESHLIIIERQLPQNYLTTRIAQHTITYFSIVLRDSPLLPTIVEVDPKLKGKMLGAPKGIGEKELKKWAVTKAEEIFIERDDQWSLAVLRSYSKQDDLADCTCQEEALFQLWGDEENPLIPIVPEKTLMKLLVVTSAVSDVIAEEKEINEKPKVRLSAILSSAPSRISNNEESLPPKNERPKRVPVIAPVMVPTLKNEIPKRNSVIAPVIAPVMVPTLKNEIPKRTSVIAPVMVPPLKNETSKNEIPKRTSTIAPTSKNETSKRTPTIAPTSKNEIPKRTLRVIMAQ